MNNIILTYKSATLRQADIDLLAPGQWLNDQCILFYYEHLSENSPHYQLFLDPSASFLLLFENELEDLNEALSQIPLQSKTLIFCPINDNSNPEALGGTHWTLLVYAVKLNKGFYFDSLSNSRANLQNASNILGKLSWLLRQPNPEINQVTIRHRQNNTYDCGVYVLMITEYISKSLDLSLTTQTSITPKTAIEMRKKISALIQQLAR